MLIGFVAGEASGDLLAAPVVSALRERLPGVAFAGTMTFTGLGDPLSPMFANRVLQGTGTMTFGSMWVDVSSTGSADAPNLFGTAWDEAFQPYNDGRDWSVCCRAGQNRS